MVPPGLSMPFPFGKSPARPLFNLIVFIVAITACLGVKAAGQASGNCVRITVPVEGDVEIEVQTSDALSLWSFRNAYGGSLGLGDRIKKFAASDTTIRKVASGEFQSDRKVSKFIYSVDLRSPEPGNMSHVSWLTAETGVLMLADLLPLNVIASDISLEIKLPDRWQADSVFTTDGSKYVIRNPQTAVFLLGPGLNRSSKEVDGMRLDLTVSANWQFGSAKVLSTAVRILEKYAELTGHRLKDRSAILIAPIPVASSASQWKAETRGSTVILLLDPAAKFSNWNAQLAVILAHELFHLWVPNSLLLKGDYDWFFEGFTLYQALLISLELKLIKFREYLETLARVYDSYLSYSDDLSLLEASERRWTSGGTLVYDKGMLLAFMYDLLIRSQSEGRSKISGLYTKLFETHADKPADGNAVIIELLNASAEGRKLSESFIEHPKVLDLASFLSKFGFHLNTVGNRSRIVIQADLSKEQKRLMRSLAYKG